MEFEILDKKENPLLNRLEVTFKVTHEGAPTPTREVVVSKIAAMLNAEKERTVLNELQSHFGVNYSIGEIRVYDSNELAMKLEPKHILKRNGLIEEE